MFSFVSRLAFSLVLATTVLAQSYTINTPSSVVVCQPALLTWQGGVGPYFLSVLPAGQPSAPPLVDLGKQTGTSVTWTVNLGAGTAVFLNLRDSTGTLAQSGQFTIIPGTNTTCIGKDIVTSAGPNVGPTTAGPVTSASASSGTKVSATGSAAASASHSATKSGAVSQYAPIGLAAFAGAAIVALIA